MGVAGEYGGDLAMDGVTVAGGADVDVAVVGVLGRQARMVGSGRACAQASSSEGVVTVAVTSPTMSSSLLMRSSVDSWCASMDVDMWGLPCQKVAG